MGSGVGGIAELGRGKAPEYQDEGNNIIGRVLPVTLASPPDLQVTLVDAPTRAERGQSIDVTYTVTNRGGVTPASQGKWSDLIYLSKDRLLDLRADHYLARSEHNGGLAAGASYTVTSSVRLPKQLLGPWHVIVVADPVQNGPVGTVFEYGKERNNDAATAVPVLIDSPPPVDLEVMAVTGPSNANGGNPVTVQWTVRNTSTEIASGNWSDTVYLSADSTWDIYDRVVGRTSFGGSLQPGEGYTSSLVADLPAVTPGPYRLIVRTDVFDHVYEDAGETNNTTVAADVCQVSAELLQLGVPLPTSLKTGQERLFRVDVPTSQTLRVSVNVQNDMATTELYLRHEAAPTAAEYDAGPETALAGDQAAIIPTTEPGTYYVLVRGYAVPGEQTSATVLAELMPLSVTDVHTDVGGDGRYVTVTIRGADFLPDTINGAERIPNTIVKLSRPGIKEYTPVVMAVLDATRIRATFDLTAPHGLYDLIVENPAQDERVVVPYRFLVERRIEPDATIGIGGPRVILAGDTGLYSVALQSLTNVDTPYTFFQVGIPEMGVNGDVYGLPFVRFASNLRRRKTGRCRGGGLGVARLSRQHERLSPGFRLPVGQRCGRFFRILVHDNYVPRPEGDVRSRLGGAEEPALRRISATRQRQSAGPGFGWTRRNRSDSQVDLGNVWTGTRSLHQAVCPVSIPRPGFSNCDDSQRVR